ARAGDAVGGAPVGGRGADARRRGGAGPDSGRVFAVAGGRRGAGRRAGPGAGRGGGGRGGRATVPQLGDGRLRGAGRGHDRSRVRPADPAAGGRPGRGRRHAAGGDSPGRSDPDHDRGADAGGRRRGGPIRGNGRAGRRTVRRAARIRRRVPGRQAVGQRPTGRGGRGAGERRAGGWDAPATTGAGAAGGAEPDDGARGSAPAGRDPLDRERGDWAGPGAVPGADPGQQRRHPDDDGAEVGRGTGRAGDLSRCRRGAARCLDGRTRSRPARHLRGRLAGRLRPGQGRAARRGRDRPLAGPDETGQAARFRPGARGAAAGAAGQSGRRRGQFRAVRPPGDPADAGPVRSVGTGDRGDPDRAVDEPRPTPPLRAGQSRGGWARPLPGPDGGGSRGRGTQFVSPGERTAGRPGAFGGGRAGNAATGSNGGLGFGI
ncbi:MAG: Molybdopterin molybdenumtransferase, partial [uncultured Thermomicrobiales bacterium]